MSDKSGTPAVVPVVSGPVVMSPVAVARLASSKYGRKVTDKQVRSAARATLARFDKVEHPERQGHAYTPREALSLLAALGGRQSGGVAEAAALAATEAPITDADRKTLGLAK